MFTNPRTTGMNSHAKPKRGCTPDERAWVNTLLSGIKHQLAAEQIDFICQRCYPLREDYNFKPRFEDESSQWASRLDTRKIYFLADDKVVDRTPKTIYPSLPVVMPRSASQKTNISDYSYDIRHVPFNEEDEELTRYIRANSTELGRLYNMSKLKNGPMLADEYCLGILTPNGVPLSSKSLRYIFFIVDLVGRLLKIAKNDTQKHDIVSLFVDYSYYVPYGSQIRATGTQKMTNKTTYSDDVLRASAQLQHALMCACWKFDWRDYIPPLKKTKSPGFFDRHPDGRPFIKSDFAFVPESLKTPEPNNIERYNFGPFKLAWLRSKGVLRNLFTALTNWKKFRKSSALKHMFSMANCAVHTEAFRNNKGDVPIGDLDDVMSFLRNPHVKDRNYAFECKPYVFEEGTVDNAKWVKAFQAGDYNRIFVPSRKRPMFPAANATFALPYIMLFRRLYGPLEHSQCGFPNSNAQTLNYLNQLYTARDEMGPSAKVFFITLDRTNAEQWISDNHEVYHNIWNKALRAIMVILTTIIVPSSYGPRVANNGMASGASETTADNSNAGGTERLDLLSAILAEPVTYTTQQILQAMLRALELFRQGDRVTLVPLSESMDRKTKYFVTLVSDDIIIGLVSTDHQAIKNRFESRAALHKARMLKGDGLVERCTSYGLDFTQQGVFVSETLGIGKLFQVEKAKNGDQIALKIWARIGLVPHFAPTIVDCIRDHAFGNADLWLNGARSYMDTIARFGYSVDEIFNVHSPTEKLVLGEFLREQKLDPTKDDLVYPEREMRDLTCLLEAAMSCVPGFNEGNQVYNVSGAVSSDVQQMADAVRDAFRITA